MPEAGRHCNGTRRDPPAPPALLGRDAQLAAARVLHRAAALLGVCYRTSSCPHRRRFGGWRALSAGQACWDCADGSLSREAPLAAGNSSEGTSGPSHRGTCPSVLQMDLPKTLLLNPLGRLQADLEHVHVEINKVLPWLEKVSAIACLRTTQPCTATHPPAKAQRAHCATPNTRLSACQGPAPASQRRLPSPLFSSRLAPWPCHRRSSGSRCWKCCHIFWRRDRKCWRWPGSISNQPP